MLDRSHAAKELLPIFEEDLPCIKRSVFLQFLDVELERAKRYGSYVSLLVFQLAEAETNGGDQPSPPLFHDYAHFIKSKLRRTDYLAYVEEQTFAVVLLNSKLENTKNVLSRLQADSSLYLTSINSEVGLKASSSVFPTEANSRSTLCDTAFGRLA